MTCAHVLDVIDAGPMVSLAPGQLDAARDHADRCAACGSAWAAAAALTSQLAALPEPDVPSDLSKAILARIARIDDRATRDEHAPAWPGWVAALGGAVAGAALLVSIAAAWQTPLALVSPRLGGLTTGVATLPVTGPAGIAFAIGLLLYVTGLFAASARHGAGGGTDSAPR